jgi:hypothetical protein
MKRRLDGSRREAKIRLRRLCGHGVMNHADISSFSVSAVSQEVTLTTTKLAPTTVEAPQATSDTAARPAPSTVLLNTQTPAEKSSPTVGVIHSSPSHADPTASISAINPASAPSYDAPDAALAKPPITDIGLASELTAVGGEQPHQDKGNDDVVMSNSPPLVQKPQNDVNMPPWLVPMINYLRGVATDTAWQNLVTEFVEFEKGDPPAGVSFFFFTKVETNSFIHIHRSCPQGVDPRRSPTGCGARRKMLYRQSNLLNSANSSWSGGQ